VIRSAGRLIAIYVVCLLLLSATIGVAHLSLGPLNTALNLGIAGAKTVLIAWYFMELRCSTGLVRLAGAAALIWLALLFSLGLTDWLSRA
jgi:cytochrome c oxidase subunit 4